MYSQEQLKAQGQALLERNRKATDAGDIDALKSLEGEIATWRKQVAEHKKAAQLRKELGSDLKPSSMSGGKAAGNDVWSRAKSRGFDYESKPKVLLGSVGAKAFIADGTDINIGPLSLSRDGADERYLYTAFPSLGLGNQTSVQGLVQSARTLATPSTMDVAIAGSDAKPESVVSVELTTFDAKMIAHVTEPIPNAVWSQPSCEQFVRQEMAYGLALGIDSFLHTSLVGAAGTTTFSQTTEFLPDAYRAAIKAARALGYRPNVALLHTNDAYDLEVLRDAADRYYGAGPNAEGFGQIWGATIIESTSVVEGSPVLVDTAQYGKLLFGETQWAVNTFSTPTVDLFGTNRSIARLESPMCVAIQQPAAIVEMTLSA